MNKIKKVAFLCLVFISYPSFTNTTEQKSIKTIKIGTEALRPPFIINEGSGIKYGYEIDMMNKLCSDMKVKCVYTYKPAYQLRKLLNSKQVDIIFGGYVNEDLSPYKYAVSLPYYEAKSRLLGLKGSKFKTIAQLENKRIGVFWFRSGLGKFVKQFPGKYTTEVFQSMPDAVQALKSNNIDAILLDNQSALMAYNNFPDFSLIGPPLHFHITYVIVALKENQALINKMNHLLLSYQSTEFYRRLFNKYIFE
jgi:ABC-type amino acid transport substrate-binding protein